MAEDRYLVAKAERSLPKKSETDNDAKVAAVTAGAMVAGRHVGRAAAGEAAGEVVRRGKGVLRRVVRRGR